MGNSSVSSQHASPSLLLARVHSSYGAYLVIRVIICSTAVPGTILPRYILMVMRTKYDMVTCIDSKNRGIYRFLSRSQVLITMVPRK